MSLTDVDKGTDGRISPKPNASDNVMQRMAHNTMSNTYRSTPEVAQRMAFKNGMILTYDENNKCSSVYGYIPEVSTVPVLIIAKEGYDVFEDVLDITAPTT